ncbi:MAG: YlxR family protein [Lachnospiraceae bacterium]|nr:YlxR family protein [Lachnospiraceae bacterium]
MNLTKGQKGKQKNKSPERQCLACRNQKMKSDLLRVVRTEEGVIYDPSGKKNGRGAYVCANPECIAKAKKTGILGRSLKSEIPPELYDILLKNIKEENE